MSDITEKYIALGEEIRKRRKEMKLTMTALANETNLSQSAISMIENGVRQPSLQALNRISQVLGFDFSQMLVNDSRTLEQIAVKSIQQSLEMLNIRALQFDLSLKLVEMQSTLPDKELNNLITSTILKETEAILSEKHIQKRLESRVSTVLKKEVERKKQELDQALDILDL